MGFGPFHFQHIFLKIVFKGKNAFSSNFSLINNFMINDDIKSQNNEKTVTQE